NATVGILPFLFLATIFSANLIINLHPIDKNVFHSLRIPTFTFSLHDVLATLQHITSQALQVANKNHSVIKTVHPTIPSFTWSIPSLILTIWYGIESIGISI